MWDAALKDEITLCKKKALLQCYLHTKNFLAPTGLINNFITVLNKSLKQTAYFYFIQFLFK